MQNLKFDRQFAFKALAVAYVALTIAYVGYHEYIKFQTNVVQRSLEQGRVETINQLINQSKVSSCQPFSVYNETESVNLIDIKCLEQQTNTPQATPEPTKTPQQ